MDSSVIVNKYNEMFKTEGFERIELMILDFCKRKLRSSSRIGESISCCVAVIFRRPDMNNVEFFKEILFWGLDSLMSTIDCN